MKFLCEQCKAKYQIADEKAAGKTVRMKCRKCGHLIEVRAAVTETSVSSVPPPPAGRGAPIGATRPRSPSLAGINVPAVEPPALRGRATPFAAGVAPRIPPPKPARPAGALEGAFKSAVQHDSTATGLPRRSGRNDDEVSAPVDMSDLSPSDEWYVAINGVPVGPIRVAEVRRKAALGAVTEDALVWQEGLDEWRPLRTFPELAASVREAMSRLSRPPPGEGRSSIPPPPPRGIGRASLPGAGLPRAAPPPPRAPPSLSPRSNVVPIMSRLATAEKLDEPPPVAQPPPMSTSVVPDPFANVPVVANPSAFTAAATFSSVAPPTKKPMPWMAFAMIASAIAFGVTTAVVIFVRPAPQQAPVAGMAAIGSSSAATPSAIFPPRASAEVAEPAPNQPPAPVRGPTIAAAPKPASTATTPGRSLDLHSLTQNGQTITPSEEQAGEGPKAPGQCFSEAQVQQVMGLHQVGIRRACWERNPTIKPTVNVAVSLTIGPEGGAQNVVATGDEPSVSKCIENDVRGWRFPAMGCSQKTGLSFKFVRQ